MIALLAAAALSIPTAKAAIVRVEQTHNPGAAVWASGCRRHTRRQVACIATASTHDASGSRLYRVRDVVTLEAHGILRVHQASQPEVSEVRIL